MTSSTDTSKSPKPLVIPLGKSWRVRVLMQVSRWFWLALLLLWLVPLLLLLLNWLVPGGLLKLVGLRSFEAAQLRTLEATDIPRLNAMLLGTNTPSATVGTPTASVVPQPSTTPTAPPASLATASPPAAPGGTPTASPTLTPTASLSPTAVLTPTATPVRGEPPGKLIRLPVDGPPHTAFLILFDGRVVGGGTLDSDGRGEARLQLGLEDAGEHTILVRERGGGRILARRDVTMRATTPTPPPPVPLELLRQPWAGDTGGSGDSGGSGSAGGSGGSGSSGGSGGGRPRQPTAPPVATGLPRPTVVPSS